MNQTAARRPDQAVAVVRLAALPVIFVGERLVEHPSEYQAAFDPLFAVACTYAVVVAAVAWHPRARPLPPLLGLVDVAFLCALVYTSGGPFSQLRAGFFLLPLIAAFFLRPRLTAAAAVLSVACYLLISLLHPAGDERPNALEFELAQAFYLALAGVAATALSVALTERAARISSLAESRNRLVAQALDAEDRERRRLAEALHDEAIQNLLAARQELAEPERADLDLVRAGLDRTVAQLRDAVFDLHPYLLEQAGLAAAVRAVASEQARRGGYEHEVEIDEAAARGNEQLLFSVTRELLVNATKHSHAGRVRVSVGRADGATVLEVTDDGVGVDPRTLDRIPVRDHIGLASCAERVHAVGGSFEIGPTAGGGTAVKVRVPAGSNGGPTRTAQDAAASA